MSRPRWLGLWWLLAAPCAAADPAAPKPDFNWDVRPILSNHCFKCHGPTVQKGKVRLDARAHAIKKDAVVPGKPSDSGMIDRVTAAADEDRMPPPETGPRLSPAEIDILRRWIAHGAEYAPHWSLVPPRRPEIPSTKSQIPIRNPIDAFVFARLAKEGLKPSPEADRTTLIRRVYLDLIGLLPSPAEVAAFVNDKSPNAYEKVVDKLLASPHYGERWARHWLDLARYADSNGFTVDGARSMWPYRDWVVQAFNDDLPFDRFTIEQLAGDLLPDPTLEQKIATGFHRNTPFNEEGGTDPEQFRDERTVDRASTTAAVWLGLTAACAQCHDHKFDPITQKDFYQLYAFFNSCDEPTLPVGGDPALEAKVNELTEEANKLKAAGKLEEGKKVEARIKKVQKSIPTTLVMRERKVPRESFVHIRGDFLRKGDKVTPGYPSALTKSPSPPVATGGLAKPLNRLDLAKWLVSADNPLTARVTVNRYWQHFFGAGLVNTENDFGSQGSPPTHPQLLDWLAVEFREDGWSVKRLHRLIVTSATYRQSSVARPDLTATDPQNKLLGRQDRLRLEAEVIRDAALSASGLLCRKMGGPGVYPPMPKEVFSFTQAKKAWPESHGADRYRRGLYTFIWRQSQHHLLTTFDGADAQTACTRRSRSNTPLQALHLANDPAFVEFAEGLGKRVEKDGPADDAGRVEYAFKLCFSRSPTAAERERVLKYLDA
ncbi:MAG TPA: PSD1 and planctomycete cytochrome C domain-containing protein, partial [Fimbriiglobus sp.]|nr:PSD1 and planctomycete cytochrome C domain-containing protein [Fimbriiglobus sp.]